MLMLVNGDYVPQGNGLRSAKGDEAVLQRMLMKLTARRGQFPFMENFGSRLWTLDRLRPAERQAAADLRSTVPYTAEAGISQWKVISEFCRTYGGFLPRFAKTGELLATPEQDSGKRIILDSGSPVLNCRIREDHYGVLTEALVIDKRQNISYSVKNPEMIAKGGQCRRVIYTPGRSTWDAMRYTGEYQIQQSKKEEQAVTVTLPGSFDAFPGDRVTVRLEKLGLTGNYRVAETENRFSAREGAVMIWTLKECG